MNKKYFFPITLFLIFIVITIIMLTNNINSFDDNIYNLIISQRNNFLDNFFIFITKFANTNIVLCLIIVLLLKLDKENRTILGIETFIVVTLNIVIKNIIKRPRPSHLRLIIQRGYSYPSAHAMLSIAIYGFLIYYLNKKITNNYLKIAMTMILSILIISIGISRIYVGVHHPSDVLSGYILSLAIQIIIINKYRGKINVKNDCK